MTEPTGEPPASVVDGMLWPAIAPPAMGAFFAMMFQLERSQWWSEAAISAAQRLQLTQLLRHAAQRTPFYRDRLAEIGAALRHPAAGWPGAAWQALPVLGRGEVQAQADALRSAPPAGHQPVKTVNTSGSTGMPVAVDVSRMTGLKLRAMTERMHLWHCGTSRGAFCAIRYQRPPAAAAEQRQPRWSEIWPTGPAWAIDVFTPLPEQADWLAHRDPEYLLTYPSNLQVLLGELAKRGSRLPALRQVRTYGEAITPELRALTREVLGVPLVDHYSSTELGMIALQCPDATHYHVMSESVLVELLDDAGRPCRPGETGRVVVTDLHNFAFPLIRYALGDLAVAGPACACGRGLPVLTEVLGRERGTMLMPDGSRRWPRGYSKLTAMASLQQLQVVQDAVDRFTLRVVAREDFDAAARAELQRRAGEVFGETARYTIEIVAAIERETSGKFQDFVCRAGA